MNAAQRRALAACLLLAAPAGCGEKEAPVAPVKGVVTIDAKPLDEATVSFVPDPGNKHVTPGVGVSETDGTFQIRHNGRFGVAPGKYKVLISKKNATKPGVEVPKAFLNDPVQQELMGVRKETLPKKYSDPASATEIVEVKEGGNTFEFDVKRSVAAKK